MLRLAKRILVPSIGAILALLVVWALWPSPIYVDTAVVTQGPLEVAVEDEGIARIRDVYTVSAPVGGKMLRSLRDVGDAVTAGQNVAVIEPTDPVLLDIRTQLVNEAAVQAGQAAIELAEAQVNQARSQQEFARSELHRAEDLASRQTISARTLEKAKLDLASADAAVASSIANLEVRRRELESARARLIQTPDSSTRSATCCINVTSPVNGRVLKIIAESEQVLQAGTPLVEIGDPNDLEIAVDFLSRDAVRLVPGATASIENWGGDATLEARVKRVEPTAFTKVSALGIEEQRVKVILDFTSPPADWRPLGHNYRVVARVTVWRADSVPLVPLGALFRQGNEWATFQIQNGRAMQRLITIGERNLRFARVLDGLKVGDTVILHASDRVRHQTRVAQRQ